MGITIDLLPGLPVQVDENVSSIGGSFFYDPPRVYDPYPLEWTYNKLKSQTDPVLYDVGASSGCFTLLAALIPDLKVCAFEPAKLAYEMLLVNVRMNNLSKVIMTPAAVSDYYGEGYFNQVKDIGGLGCSMLGGVPFEGKECEPVEVGVIRLDDCLNDSDVFAPPTLIKIDTEGGELAVLLGAIKTIKLYHPVIVSEYEPLCTAQYGYHPDLLVAMLKGLGYKCTVDGTNLYAEFE